MIATHLWYLYALIYGYAVIYVWNKQRINWLRWVFIIGMFLTLNLKYILVHWGFELPVAVYRNAFTIGIPCMFIGEMVYEKRKIIGKWKNKIVLAMAIIGLVVALCEYHFIAGGRFNDLYNGIIFATVAIFVLAINNPIMLQNLFMVYVGKNLSTWIYVFYAFIGVIVQRFLVENIERGYMYTVFVLVLVTIYAVIVVFCRNRFQLRTDK